jgi:hypothetical protein
MNGLKHLMEEKCPDCGAETQGLAVTGTHTCGEQFESRTYKCGRVDEWTPNFSRMENKHPCKRTPQYNALEEKREAALVKLREFIKELDVDDAYKYNALYETLNFRYTSAYVATYQLSALQEDNVI